MPELIQLGLSEAIAKAAKEHSAIIDALPSDGASVVVNQDGVTAIGGIDVTKRTTLGGWVSKQKRRAIDYGVALRVRWGGK